MSDSLYIPSYPTWEWFCDEVAGRWPELPAPSVDADGCWPDAIAWLHKHQKVQEALHLLMTASGDRAGALLLAAYYNFIPEREDALRDLIMRATGDQALALYRAARYKLIPEREDALRDLIMRATGDQALALYRTVQYGLITSAEVRCACG